MEYWHYMLCGIRTWETAFTQGVTPITKILAYPQKFRKSMSRYNMVCYLKMSTVYSPINALGAKASL